MYSAYRFEAGLIALDFINTWSIDVGERLPDEETLAQWWSDGGLRPAPLEVTAVELNAARAARTVFRRAMDKARNGKRVASRDVAQLNRMAAVAVPGPVLRIRAGVPAVEQQPASVAVALGLLARQTIELLADPERLARTGECAAKDCDSLFIDSSRGGQRRWCSSEVCGNRARVKALRARA